jgi:hypothetical protein
VEQELGKFGASVGDTRVADWLERPTESFVAAVAKAAGTQKFSGAEAERLVRYRKKARTQHANLLGRLLDHEKCLAGLVEKAYGLTEEQVGLLRTTKPPRDPIDVLEARLKKHGDL